MTVIVVLACFDVLTKEEKGACYFIPKTENWSPGGEESYWLEFCSNQKKGIRFSHHKQQFFYFLSQLMDGALLGDF